MTRTVIPTSAAELEEMLGDQAKVQASIADGTFPDVIKGYAKIVAEKDAGQRQQSREQVQAILADMLKNDPELRNKFSDARPDISAATARRQSGSNYNAQAAGAALDGQFTSVGDLVCALSGERSGNRAAAERMSKLRNDFSSSIPAEGGFLIPEEYRSQILRSAEVQAIVRPRATVIPMGAPRVRMPMVEDQNQTEGIDGGVLTFWEPEGAAFTESAPKWGEVALDASSLTAYTELPNTLISDSAISVQGVVDEAFPRAIRKGEDRAFLYGHGAGMPLGVLHANNAAAVTVAAEAGQAAGTILWENLINMFARMLPDSMGSAVWLANINTFPELATMALSIGTAGSAVWLNNGVEGPPMSILGRPVIFTTRSPSVAAAGGISLIDFSYYLIGDRQQMSAMWSEHFKFNTNSQAYRIIQRLDGRPWLKNPITPEEGSATLSPFVKLAAR